MMICNEISLLKIANNDDHCNKACKNSCVKCWLFTVKFWTFHAIFSLQNIDLNKKMSRDIRSKLDKLGCNQISPSRLVKFRIYHQEYLSFKRILCEQCLFINLQCIDSVWMYLQTHWFSKYKCLKIVLATKFE